MTTNTTDLPNLAPQLEEGDFEPRPTGLLTDLAGGAALVLAWALLWSWFALAVVPPDRTAAPQPPAVTLRA